MSADLTLHVCIPLAQISCMGPGPSWETSEKLQLLSENVPLLFPPPRFHLCQS